MFSKIDIDSSFSKQYFGAYLFAFFKNDILEKNKENIKTRLVPKSLFVFFCYLVF